MKQPMLIVEGNRHAVVSIEWFDGKPTQVGVMKNGVYTIYHDVSQPYYVEPQLKIDLKKALVPSTDDDVVDGIRRKIEGYEEVMNDLANDGLKEYRKCKKAPFTSDELDKIDKQHEHLGYVVDGLHEALGVILMQGGENR